MDRPHVGFKKFKKHWLRTKGKGKRISPKIRLILSEKPAFRSVANYVTATFFYRLS